MGMYLNLLNISCLIIVSDDESPDISACPPNITTSADLGKATALINWTNPSAVDNSDPNPTISCTPPSGDQFNIGQNEVVLLDSK